ncbi:hypothetical protein RintRC_4613 [Richelia intracellularis]|nr:hypothetical protein RintRC_4613 [Richelia intracellularis]
MTSGDRNSGPFATFADAIAFAAGLGAKHNKRVPLGEISKGEPGPIRLEIFVSIGHDWLIKLLGITETRELEILSLNDEEHQAQRNHIFEEYAA